MPSNQCPITNQEDALKHQTCICPHWYRHSTARKWTLLRLAPAASQKIRNVKREHHQNPCDRNGAPCEGYACTRQAECMKSYKGTLPTPQHSSCKKCIPHKQLWCECRCSTFALLMHASPYPSVTSVSNGITEQYPEMPSSPEMHAHCQKLWTHNIRVVWGHSFNWSNEQCRPTYAPPTQSPGHSVPFCFSATKPPNAAAATGQCLVCRPEGIIGTRTAGLREGA